MPLSNALNSTQPDRASKVLPMPNSVPAMYGLIGKHSQQNGTISKVMIVLVDYIFIK
jgi:hypothetical protein